MRRLRTEGGRMRLDIVKALVAYQHAEIENRNEGTREIVSRYKKTIA